MRSVLIQLSSSILLIFLMLGGGVAAGEEQLTSLPMLASAIEATESAKQNGFLWSTSVELLEAAQQANESGDTALAETLAAEVLQQIELAAEQARTEQSRWSTMVPH